MLGPQHVRDISDNTTVNRITAVTSLAAVGMNLTGVTAVVAGNDNTCYALQDGTLRCNGYNAQGQVGDGTLTTRTLPVTVLTGPGVNFTGLTQWSTNADHSCAVMSDGSEKCWATT